VCVRVWCVLCVCVGVCCVVCACVGVFARQFVFMYTKVEKI